MNKIRILDLIDLDRMEQNRVLLAHRPESRDSRLLWWNEIVDQVMWSFAEATSIARQNACLNLALSATDLAEKEGDLSAVDTVVMLEDLKSRAEARDISPGVLAADELARRALDAIRIDESRLPEIVARERDYLMTDTRAWKVSPGSEYDTDDEFDQLDDLRRVIPIVKRLAPQIVDKLLRNRATLWLNLETSIKHGPEIGERGRSLLANRPPPRTE